MAGNNNDEWPTTDGKPAGAFGLEPIRITGKAARDTPRGTSRKTGWPGVDRRGMGRWPTSSPVALGDPIFPLVAASPVIRLGSKPPIVTRAEDMTARVIA
jgi:hypothetical protein